MKSLASNQQEKTGRRVKELFSSLSPTPTTIQSIPGVYPTTPLASAASPPTSVGMTSPSPEIGLQLNGGVEECDGGMGGTLRVNSLSPHESSPVPDMETERFVAFTTEAM